MIIHSVTTPGDAESLQIIFIFSSSARFLASFVQPAILTNNLHRAVSRRPSWPKLG
jgi:hypothetical protein